MTQNKKTKDKQKKKLPVVAKVFIWAGAILGGILLLLFIVFTILAFTMGDGEQIGKWRSEEGKREYEAAYSAAMQQMPPYEKEFNIETEFGTVRAYRWDTDKTRDKTPIVLLPGRTSGVPMWSENLDGLIAERPVYAMDALGDSGMSTQTKPITSDEDQAKWIEQTLAGLELDNVHILGHSFGGWTAANYASHYPDRLASLSLLEPVRVFTDMNLSVYISSIPASLPFLPQSWRNHFLEQVSGEGELDTSDPMARMIAAATDHYGSALPLPGLITPDQMQAWNMPVYVAMGADSFMHDSAKAVEVAEENIKNLEIRNWPGGTHSLPMEESQRINAELLTFMQKVDDER